MGKGPGTRLRPVGFGRASRLTVKWFTRWEPYLDDALAEFPQTKSCPHDLFARFMQTPGRNRRRTALVSASGEPIAVVGLRARKHFWEPIFSAGVCPRAKMPARDGMLFPAVAALGVDVWMGGWEDAPPSHLPNVRSAFALPMFKVNCADGPYEHWKRSGNWTAVKSARNRTKAFTLEIDGHDAAEWIIRRWELTWRDHPSRETICADDQLIAAQYFQPRGQLHTFRLLDRGDPVGGYTAFVYEDELVLVCNYRAPEYTHASVGLRLFELIVEWATAAGLARVDLGGGHAYKARWAPIGGERWYFNVCPAYLYAPKYVVRSARRLLALRSGTPLRSPDAAAPLVDRASGSAVGRSMVGPT